jgi:hypothetical protein
MITAVVSCEVGPLGTCATDGNAANVKQIPRMPNPFDIIGPPDPFLNVDFGPIADSRSTFPKLVAQPRNGDSCVVMKCSFDVLSTPRF